MIDIRRFLRINFVRFPRTSPQRFPRYWIVYLAINLVNGKGYVGCTTKRLFKRLTQHLKSRNPFGLALRKYGVENFKFVVLDKAISEKELLETETSWIAVLHTQAPNGYNITAGGRGLLSPSEETRKKLVNSHLGQKSWNKGLRMPKEYREKLSIAHMGQPGFWIGKTRSEETRNKQRVAMLGKPGPNKGRKFSDEARQKISLGHMGQKAWNKGVTGYTTSKKGTKCSPKACENMRLAQLGRKDSVKTKAKKSASAKAAWAVRRAA